MSKRPARRELIISALTLAGVILAAAWVTYSAYRQQMLRAPLIRAVRKNDAELVRHLLAQGADPNAQDVPEEKLTLGEFLKRLLRPVRSAPSSAPTALMIATQKDPNVTRLLIAAGADVNRQTANGESALSWAAASGNVATVRLLLDWGADANLASENGTTPLISGARNPDIVQALLEHGADPNVTDKIRFNPLMLAVMGDSLQSVRLLVSHGANLNAVRNGGYTALMYAISGTESDPFPISSFLIEHGANPNARNSTGRTPLYFACQPGRTAETARLLLKYGANVNARDSNGDTPLHEAVGNVDYNEQEGNLEVVRLLLAHGADTRIKNRLGYTPLMKTPKDSPDIRRLLQAAGR